MSNIKEYCQHKRENLRRASQLSTELETALIDTKRLLHKELNTEQYRALCELIVNCINTRVILHELES